MIDVYTHGTEVGISFTNLGGFLLLNYLVFEIIILFRTKSPLIHKLFFWLMVRREVKKIIPDWWDINSIRFVSISKKGAGWIVYVELRSNIPSNKRWVSDWVICDFWGRIKDQVLIKRIKSEDKYHVEEIKSWKRDKALEDIGI
jgi:hypothetical protein